eukprot:4387220-Prymnesium_polylepis.1
MQAAAICELHAPAAPYAAGSASAAAADAGLRVPGGWEVVRVYVSHLSDDTREEADALREHVWPRLAERCRARRLHLLVVDPREVRVHVRGMRVPCGRVVVDPREVRAH